MLSFAFFIYYTEKKAFLQSRVFSKQDQRRQLLHHIITFVCVKLVL